MSETFHPAEDLAPIKARSEEMMNKAALLLKSDIPTNLKQKRYWLRQNATIKSKALHELVTSNGADAAIVNQLLNCMMFS
jgi:Spy/CpxP family protein refolding chaperone